jgi:hypothetical protein
MEWEFLSSFIVGIVMGSVLASDKFLQRYLKKIQDLKYGKKGRKFPERMLQYS